MRLSYYESTMHFDTKFFFDILKASIISIRRARGFRVLSLSKTKKSVFGSIRSNFTSFERILNDFPFFGRSSLDRKQIKLATNQRYPTKFFRSSKKSSKKVLNTHLSFMFFSGGRQNIKWHSLFY